MIPPQIMQGKTIVQVATKPPSFGSQFDEWNTIRLLFDDGSSVTLTGGDHGNDNPWVNFDYKETHA